MRTPWLPLLRMTDDRSMAGWGTHVNGGRKPSAWRADARAMGEPRVQETKDNSGHDAQVRHGFFVGQNTAVGHPTCLHWDPVRLARTTLSLCVMVLRCGGRSPWRPWLARAQRRAAGG